jgi:hypothetical protein
MSCISMITPDLAHSPTLRELACLPRDTVAELVCHILRSVDRPGMEALVLAMGEDMDFFSSPASIRHHSSCPGGLALHSLIVHRLLSEKNVRYELGLPHDTVAVTSLCHDVCKAGIYTRVTKARKKGTKVSQWGKVVPNWVDEESWEINDPFPVGHSEKSVIMLQRYISLTDLEIALIMGHMGGFDERKRVFDNLAALWPAVVALHTADTEASYLVESRA